MKRTISDPTEGRPSKVQAVDRDGVVTIDLTRPTATPDTAAASPLSGLFEQAEMVYCGKVVSKVVGLRYYSGVVSQGEAIQLIREPSNPYDRNAIRVDNIHDNRVGHIKREDAANFARILGLDRTGQGRIQLEGIMPRASNTAVYSIGCEVSVWAEPVLAQAVQEMLPRSFWNNYVRTAPTQPKTTKVAQKAMLKALGIKSKEDLPSDSDTDKLVRSLFADRNFDTMEEKAPPSDIIRTELFPYQKQALEFMLNREKESLVSVDTDDSMWVSRKGGYYHTVARTQQNEHPADPCRGGILADEMGFGKSLQMLSLIAASECTSPTLIVCPLSVMSHWHEEVQKHCPSLPVTVYHGTARTLPESFGVRHVVLTTYGLLANSPALERQAWGRIILDEAHNIRNQATKQSKAAMRLEAPRRWCVTGTPLSNSINDLQTLFAFIKAELVSDKQWWQRLVARKIRQKEPEGYIFARATLNHVMLRRTKQSQLRGKPILELPDVTSSVVQVSLNDDDRRLYDQIMEKSKNFFKARLHAGDAMSNYSNLLALLMHMRRLCDHSSLVSAALVKSIQQVEAASAEDIKALLEKVKDALKETEECPICFEVLERKTVTSCGHIFCRSCITEVIGHQGKCPMCRADIQASALVTAPSAQEENLTASQGEGGGASQADGASDNNGVESLETTESAKIAALITELTETRKSDPTVKSVVFSQFTTFLELIEPLLTGNGFKFVKLTGSMSAKQRHARIVQFREDPETTIFLVSLRAGGVGLDLTSASKVYLLDPWWNPFVEDQAEARIHRIGQTRPVEVTRFVTVNTIEERVIAIQAKRRKLAHGFMGHQKKADLDRMRTRDLCSLFEIDLD